jgi:hypothetical protein
MRKRAAILCIAQVLMASSTVAEELNPEQAKAFVVGKLFAYTCFDGTAGMGRIFADGSVVGTVTPGGMASHDSRPYQQVQSKLTETPYAPMFRACQSCRALGCNELVRKAFVGRSQDLSPLIATSISGNRPPN